jgi:phosphonate transport system substrate-binding protein
MVGEWIYASLRRILSWGFKLRASSAGLLIALSLIANSPIAAAESSSKVGALPILRIGFTPGEESDGLSLRTAELGQLLEKKLEASGTRVRIQTQVGRSYEDLVEQLKNQKVDFAFLNALSFVRAEEALHLKVLLKKVWENPYYYSVLLTQKRSAFKTLQSLQKARFAFVSEGSGSGHLYPLVALKGAKLDIATLKPEQIRFTGAHDRSVELLKRGEVDVIAVFSNTKSALDSAWTQHGGRVGDVRVLWVSEPIPNDPFVVRKDYYDRHPRLVHELMLSLIELSESEAERPTLTRLLGVKSLMWATAQQYDPVRRISALSKELSSSSTPESGASPEAVRPPRETK